MQPQQGDLPGLCGCFRVCPHHPLDDPSHIPEVEGVVGLGGGGQQLLPDLVVHIDGAVHDCTGGQHSPADKHSKHVIRQHTTVISVCLSMVLSTTALVDCTHLHKNSPYIVNYTS